MNNQSLVSFNKISAEIDRLSNIFNHQQIFHQHLQKVLKNNDLSSHSSSQPSLENIDIYFKEYDNPTTKSLPFDDQSSQNAQLYEQPTQIIDTIYRNNDRSNNEEGDRDHIHDDKSTVILLPSNNHSKKQKERIQNLQIAKSLANYNSLKLQNQNPRNEAYLNKSKKVKSKKGGISSMPSEVYTSQNKQQLLKYQSLSKHNNKGESPNITQIKCKKSNNQAESENYLIKELKNKLSKISKIDKDELTRLQQKKNSKKTELSSNRKKTKRQLNKAKSSSNIKNAPKLNYTSSNNFTANKTIGNQSVKQFQNKKIQMGKKVDDKLTLNYDWQKHNEKISSNNKKLNRINIGRLQENMKKINEKKYNAIRQLGKKVQKTKEKKHERQISNKKQQELKLHFTEDHQDSLMAQIIKQKHLSKEYNRQTQRYIEASRRMSKEYFSILIKECRQTSQEAILKLKLVTLMIYFYDQFVKIPFTANCNIPLKNQDSFFTYISQQEIIEILLHPSKIIKIIENLPGILINDNVISSQRFQIFTQKFGEINEQLDQQLEFFLIKKSSLYMFIHLLSEYMNFLLQKQLIGKTKRTKLVQNQVQKINGFYSSRSKKDDFSKKYLKKNQGPHRFGYRCDSDRKITLDDEQMFLKMPTKNMSKPQFSHKNPLKKIFK